MDWREPRRDYDSTLHRSMDEGRPPKSPISTEGNLYALLREPNALPITVLSVRYAEVVAPRTVAIVNEWVVFSDGWTTIGEQMRAADEIMSTSLEMPEIPSELSGQIHSESVCMSYPKGDRSLFYIRRLAIIVLMQDENGIRLDRKLLKIPQLNENNMCIQWQPSLASSTRIDNALAIQCESLAFNINGLQATQNVTLRDLLTDHEALQLVEINPIAFTETVKLEGDNLHLDYSTVVFVPTSILGELDQPNRDVFVLMHQVTAFSLTHLEFTSNSQIVNLTAERLTHQLVDNRKVLPARDQNKSNCVTPSRLSPEFRVNLENAINRQIQSSMPTSPYTLHTPDIQEAYARSDTPIKTPHSLVAGNRSLASYPDSASTSSSWMREKVSSESRTITATPLPPRTIGTSSQVKRNTDDNVQSSLSHPSIPPKSSNEMTETGERPTAASRDRASLLTSTPLKKPAESSMVEKEKADRKLENEAEKDEVHQIGLVPSKTPFEVTPKKTSCSKPPSRVPSSDMLTARSPCRHILAEYRDNSPPDGIFARNEKLSRRDELVLDGKGMSSNSDNQKTLSGKSEKENGERTPREAVQSLSVELPSTPSKGNKDNENLSLVTSTNGHVALSPLKKDEAAQTSQRMITSQYVRRPDSPPGNQSSFYSSTKHQTLQSHIANEPGKEVDGGSALSTAVPNDISPILSNANVLPSGSSVSLASSTDTAIRVPSAAASSTSAESAKSIVSEKNVKRIVKQTLITVLVDEKTGKETIEKEKTKEHVEMISQRTADRLLQKQDSVAKEEIKSIGSENSRRSQKSVNGSVNEVEVNDDSKSGKSKARRRLEF